MLFKGAEPCLSACPKSQAKASPTPSCLGPTAWHLGLRGPRDNGVGWSPARPSRVAVEHLEARAFWPLRPLEGSLFRTVMTLLARCPMLTCREAQVNGPPAAPLTCY